MKKLILIGIIILLSGCSSRSYTETINYPDKTIKREYQNINIGNKSSYYPYCRGDDCCNPDGMYIQDDIGW